MGDKRGDRHYPSMDAPPSLRRGGKWYDMPCNGELKRGLSVLGKFDQGDNRWLHEDGIEGEWAVSYHGTGLHKGASIAENGFVWSHGQRGIYSTPHLEVAFKYASVVEHGGKCYQVVVQNRVNPSKVQEVQMSRRRGGRHVLWVVPWEDDIRPYGLILREQPRIHKSTFL